MSCCCCISIFDPTDLPPASDSKGWTQGSGQEVGVTITAQQHHFTQQFYDYFCRRCFPVISLRPSTPPPVFPPPGVLIAQYLSRMRTFLSICLFFAPRWGPKKKSYPLRESSCRAHACLYGEWFTDVYQEWIDQRQSHDRRSIKHQIKDGNPRAEHGLKIRHFFFLFTGTNTSNTFVCKNEIRWALFGELGRCQPRRGSALKRWNLSAAELALGANKTILLPVIQAR